MRGPAGQPLRDHIAEVAAALFYSDGIHVVGVDRVAAEASVTKRTLYRHFPSKDALIAAALQAAPPIAFPREGSARDRILGAFELLERFLTGTRYRGCPFIIYAAELTDSKHPARILIETLVYKRRAWFKTRAAEAGAADPEILSEQLDVLFDGALASGAKRGELKPVAAALAAARILLDGQAPASARRNSSKR
ncbi:MAG: TetR/AcrR family transcriptional regulator [Candidatus Eremiobacteraeota bacterium]|nr:TetR/AcrR family transcriptional regulator [Candidatus Eremiobacteraeota bacterium]